MSISLIEAASKVAWSFLGKPYLWGGDDPMAGFDCSGSNVEILKSVGVLPRTGDWNAAGLYSRFTRTETPHEGCLVFWEDGKGRIIHVEYCLDNFLSIGASGGGPHILTEADAIKYNAYIKIRPFRSRDGIYGFVNPFAI